MVNTISDNLMGLSTCSISQNPHSTDEKAEAEKGSMHSREPAGQRLSGLCSEPLQYQIALEELNSGHVEKGGMVCFKKPPDFTGFESWLCLDNLASLPFLYFPT